MDIKEFDRKPFSVRAVQVTLENVEEVAKWSSGRVELVPTRMLNTEVELPCVKLKSQSSRTGEADAFLGYWVVELNGSYRSYKPAQFNATFVEKQVEVTEDHNYGEHLNGIVLPAAESLESNL